jgi:hypothetical protein
LKDGIGETPATAAPMGGLRERRMCLSGVFPRSARRLCSLGLQRETFASGPCRGGEYPRSSSDFERRNPHITCNSSFLVGAHEKLLTAFAGDALPDLCQLGIPGYRNSRARRSANLDQLVASSRIIAGKTISRARETNIVAGGLYGIPWYVDTRVLFYRSDLLGKRFRSPTAFVG